MAHRYVIALGSNVRHHRHGRPRDVLVAALAALEAEGLRVERRSPLRLSAPLGPSRRRYANAAALVGCGREPTELLAILKRTERQFGRRRGGGRWRERVLDIDVVLWDGGAFATGGLIVPHVAFREREFVLGPVAAVAPDWRDPITRLTVRQLLARLTRPRPVPR